MKPLHKRAKKVLLNSLETKELEILSVHTCERNLISTALEPYMKLKTIEFIYTTYQSIYIITVNYKNNPVSSDVMFNDEDIFCHFQNLKEKLIKENIQNFDIIKTDQNITFLSSLLLILAFKDKNNSMMFKLKYETSDRKYGYFND